MTIHYPEILNHRSAPQIWEWDERDSILYALALGLGNDPLNPRALPFVYEQALKAVPTFPTVLAWIAEPTFEQLGVDPVTALHGEQRIELHHRISFPVPCSRLWRTQLSPSSCLWPPLLHSGHLRYDHTGDRTLDRSHYFFLVRSRVSAIREAV